MRLQCFKARIRKVGYARTLVSGCFGPWRQKTSCTWFWWSHHFACRWLSSPQYSQELRQGPNWCLSCGKVKYGAHKHGWRKMLLCTWLHTYGLCHDAIGPCPSGNRGRSLQPCCTDWEHLLVWALLLQCRKCKGLIALANAGSLLTRDWSVMPRFRCLKYWFSCPYYCYRKFLVE